MIGKIIFLALVTVFSITWAAINVKEWGLRAQRYFIRVGENGYGGGEQFEGPFFLFILRAIIIFTSILIPLGLFSAMFGPVILYD
jgi:hypothetical protein